MASDIQNEDKALVKKLSAQTLNAFRDYSFDAEFIQRHPSIFLTWDWINIGALRGFLRERGYYQDLNLSESSEVQVKQELIDETLLPDQPAERPLVYTTREDGHEVTYILDSDEEIDSIRDHTTDENPESKAPSSSQDGSYDLDSDYMDYQNDDNISRCSSPTAVDYDDMDSDGETGGICSVDEEIGGEDDSDIEIASVASAEVDDSSDWEESSTVWLDKGISSQVRKERTQVNRLIWVDCIEKVQGGIPSNWPISKVPTAYLIDLSDPKYQRDGKEVELDQLLADESQEHWTYDSRGFNDSLSKIRIIEGHGPVACRRVRQICAGVYACERVDPKYLNVKRYELDIAAHESLIEAQIRSRVEEASSFDKRALTFWMVSNSRSCNAIDSEGEQCMGKPIIKRRKTPNAKGCYHFIACSGWTKDWRTEHRSYSIPDDVDENVLIKLSQSVELDSIARIPTCTRILRSRNGGLRRHCHYPHNADGSLSKLIKHKCEAYRTIFVPIDKTIRQAVIIYGTKQTRSLANPQPHNHPILPQTKVTHAVESLYLKCIRARGIVGSTTLSVQNAPSTAILLDGKTPETLHPALSDNRQLRRIIRAEKVKHFPHGTGWSGVWDEYEKGMKKPMSERYIHKIVTSNTGGRIIFTLVPGLIKLIHEVKQIQGDGTFKRVEGEFDEYEITIWHEATARTLTIARIYFDKKDMSTYKCIFDGLQELVRHLTGRDLRFKALHPEGNLLAFGSDMELAELQAVGESFRTSIDPTYFGLQKPTGEDIMKHISRICHVHCKRGVDNLKGKVSPEVHERLMQFMYLPNKEAVEAFTAWITELNQPQVTAWWNHKLQPFILSGIVQCCSSMSAETWAITDSTTNMNESQHAWTNKFTGTKLSLVEAILTAMKLDFDTFDAVQASLQSGVLKNAYNSEFDRTARRINRQTVKSKKRKMRNLQNEQVASLQHEIAGSKANTRVLEEQLKAATGTRPRIRKRDAESSSSGRAPPVKESRARARQTAAPYPVTPMGSGTPISTHSEPAQDIAQTQSLTQIVPSGVAPAREDSPAFLSDEHLLPSNHMQLPPSFPYLSFFGDPSFGGPSSDTLPPFGQFPGAAMGYASGKSHLSLETPGTPPKS
ncbi:hypothetical protein F5878DRAFT_724507 [Lentinula raphanica]|uniref:Uncharacterized protein n=1 Tax=Lentinula raphanica TaxID=153919 RepID=A0AA38UFB5_9AGAR|nr:hypothetical protein F5878DRAFT_724507 [Lentinula raphanica]